MALMVAALSCRRLVNSWISRWFSSSHTVTKPRSSRQGAPAMNGLSRISWSFVTLLPLGTGQFSQTTIIGVFFESSDKMNPLLSPAAEKFVVNVATIYDHDATLW